MTEPKPGGGVILDRVDVVAEGVMPLPYSADLRGRVLWAHEHGEGDAAALAARFRLALNTVKNWVRAAEREGRRVAKPLGRGPAPRLGEREQAVLRLLVAADNDATLSEYRERLVAQTGVRVSVPVLCVALKRFGLSRKKRLSARANRSARTSPPSAPPSGRRSSSSRPRTSSPSTRPASAPS